MKIEKLTDNKIKVTLTTTDLINLNIDVERLSPDSKELHSFLFSIMETIREETGFNPYSGQVVVEAMPSRDGMSITVSRIQMKSKKISRDEFNSATSVKAKIKKSSLMDIFYFDSFNDLCTALGEVSMNDLADASLYQINSTYCFAVKDDAEHIACRSVMSEFSGGHSVSSAPITYIKEHGKLIAKGIELVHMTENIKHLK